MECCTLLKRARPERFFYPHDYCSVGPALHPALHTARLLCSVGPALHPALLARNHSDDQWKATSQPWLPHPTESRGYTAQAILGPLSALLCFFAAAVFVPPNHGWLISTQAPSLAHVRTLRVCRRCRCPSMPAMQHKTPSRRPATASPFYHPTPRAAKLHTAMPPRSQSTPPAAAWDPPKLTVPPPPRAKTKPLAAHGSAPCLRCVFARVCLCMCVCAYYCASSLRVHAFRSCAHVCAGMFQFLCYLHVCMSLCICVRLHVRLIPMPVVRQGPFIIKSWLDIGLQACVVCGHALLKERLGSTFCDLA